jgi:hypothetical protein
VRGAHLLLSNDAQAGLGPAALTRAAAVTNGSKLS